MNADATNTAAPPVKLTKSALSKFIVWSSSRYNSYLLLGTKKEAVDRIFEALTTGADKNGAKEFVVECAGSVGETYNGRSSRYWKTKQGAKEYRVNTETKTVVEQYSKREIKFL